MVSISGCFQLRDQSHANAQSDYRIAWLRNRTNPVRCHQKILCSAVLFHCTKTYYLLRQMIKLWKKYHSCPNRTGRSDLPVAVALAYALPANYQRTHLYSAFHCLRKYTNIRFYVPLISTFMRMQVYLIDYLDSIKKKFFSQNKTTVNIKNENTQKKIVILEDTR